MAVLTSHDAFMKILTKKKIEKTAGHELAEIHSFPLLMIDY